MVTKIPDSIDMTDWMNSMTWLVMRNIDFNQNHKIDFDELLSLDSNRDGFFDVSDVKEYFNNKLIMGPLFREWVDVTCFKENSGSASECCMILGEKKCELFSYMANGEISVDSALKAAGFSYGKIFSKIVSDLEKYPLFYYLFDGLPQTRQLPGVQKDAENLIDKYDDFKKISEYLSARKSWNSYKLIDLNWNLVQKKEKPQIVDALNKLVQWAKYKKLKTIGLEDINEALSRIFDVRPDDIKNIEIVSKELPDIFNKYLESGILATGSKAKILNAAGEVDTALHSLIETCFNGIEGIKYRKNVTPDDLKEQFNAIGSLLSERLGKIGLNTTYTLVEKTEDIYRISLKISIPTISPPKIAQPNLKQQ